MKNKIQNYNESIFESIKYADENGYWNDYELQNTLEYNVYEQITEVRKLSKCANNTEVMIIDYILSRYSCYLIVQNRNPRKELVRKNFTIK